MKFSKNNAQQFQFGKVRGWLLVTKEDFENLSASLVEVKPGKVLPVKNTKSDRLYFVIEGEGEFVVGGKKFEVEKDNVVVIPKNTFYSYKTMNGFKFFEVNNPAFDINCEVRSRR